MPFFYKYKPQLTNKNYKQAWRLQTYTQIWLRCYFLVKYNALRPCLGPLLTAWTLRSFYTQRLHCKARITAYKALYIHLWFILDVWRLGDHQHLSGYCQTYPIHFQVRLENTLQIYGKLTTLISRDLLNRNKIVSYKVTPSWVNYKPQASARAVYHYYNVWYSKCRRALKLRQKQPFLWWLNRWYLQNSPYHLVQSHIGCHLPTQLPPHWTHVSWLRLLRYPALYNYRWFSSLVFLSGYGWRESLPWEVLYQSTEQKRLFDPLLRGTVRLIRSLISLR